MTIIAMASWLEVYKLGDIQLALVTCGIAAIMI